MAKLERLLASDDTRAIDVATEYQPLFRAALPAHWKAIFRLINAFDFQPALHALHAAREQTASSDRQGG